MLVTASNTVDPMKLVVLPIKTFRHFPSLASVLSLFNTGAEHNISSTLNLFRHVASYIGTTDYRQLDATAPMTPQTTNDTPTQTQSEPAPAK